MNKTGFIKEISKQTGYDEERCKASLNEDEAENVYDIIIKIIGTEIKNKLKHPFKSNNP